MKPKLILKDPWLTCYVNPRVTLNHLTLIDKRVSSLMEADNMTWDVDLMRDLFNERDAKIILKIPLNSSRQSDVWYWCFENSGYFSVKSAYRNIQEVKERETNINSSEFWNNLWKLRMPPKVKNML